jgi:hypothetical protein
MLGCYIDTPKYSPPANAYQAGIPRAFARALSRLNPCRHDLVLFLTNFVTACGLSAQ